MNKENFFEEDKKEIELSQSEVYFEWWLEELKKEGLILNWQRSETYILRPPLTFDFNQNYKSKNPLIKQVNVLRDIRYTPDYTVLFHKKLLSKLFAVVSDGFIKDGPRENIPGNIWQEILFLTTDDNTVDESCYVYFDVKPPSQAARFSGALSSSKDFPIKQRMMFEDHNIFVNKVIPMGQATCLFTKTFVPKRYLWTDKSTRLRKLKPYEEKADNLTKYLEKKSITL